MVDAEQASHTQKRAVAAAYDGLAADWDRIGPRLFSTLGQRLVEFASVRPGDIVLDVATGRGAILIPATMRVGAQGRVIGIDLSEAMVQRAAAEVRDRGLTHAEIRQMDAEQLQFADWSFDAVFCGFSVHHFPHPERALAEFFRVLRPGGTVALSTWVERPALLTWLRAALRPYGDVAQLTTCAFDQPGDLEAALRRAGFIDLRATRETADIVYADEAEWWASNWAFLQREALDRLTPATFEEIKAAAIMQAAQAKQPDGVHQRWGALLAAGTRAR